ncbi:RHS repeat-associated core domain-containing protein [Candidatus Woesearchaeota archaeon]|nr:RHS repeat-associated core domain-containing protein [Candidatus Woesearchaeota archaeon]
MRSNYQKRILTFFLLIIVLGFLLVMNVWAKKSPLLITQTTQLSKNSTNSSPQDRGIVVINIPEDNESLQDNTSPEKEPLPDTSIVQPITREIQYQDDQPEQESAKIDTQSNEYRQESVSKNTSTFYVIGSSLLAEIDQDNNYRYIHGDHLNSVSLRTDERGTVKTSIEYYPFGEVLREHSEASRLLYTGKEQDKDTGLYYYGQRYYLPSAGRFISVDVWEGQLTNPQTLNKYVYALNNPISFVDEQGLKPRHGATVNDHLHTSPTSGYTYYGEKPMFLTVYDAALLPLKYYNEYKATQRDFATLRATIENAYWQSRSFYPRPVLPADYYVTHTFDVPRDFVLKTLKQTQSGREFEHFRIFTNSRWEGKGGILSLDGQPVTPEEQALYLKLSTETNPPRTETIYRPIFQASFTEPDSSFTQDAPIDATSVMVPVKIEYEWIIKE